MDSNIQPTSMQFIQENLAARPYGKGQLPKDETASPPGDSIEISKSKEQPGNAPKTIKVNILPQDPAVGPPKLIEFPQEKIGDKVSGERVVMVDKNNPKAIPDLDGNYIYEVGTPQFDQVNSFTTVYRTLDMYQNYRGARINWAFDNDKLSVLPHKQEGKNAYYSRYEASVNFWYFKSPALGKTVQNSESADVDSHETGHATLDGMKPGYLGWDSETSSVHEAFGDITAMLFALQDEDNIRMVLEESGGDFSKESLISRLGEEFGKAIHAESPDPEVQKKIYLRSMLNNFTYADPDTLPDKPQGDALGGEPHNFSRLLSASVYDVLGKMYAKGVEEGKEPKEALAAARDTLGKIFTKCFDLTPEYQCKYKDVALAMIKTDRLENGGQNEALIKDVFLARKIITQEDIDGLNSHMASTQQLKAKKNISNAQDVQKFLEKYGDSLGVPDGTTMQLRNIVTDKNGNKFVNLQFSRELDLAGREYGKYDGYCVDVSGGLTLAFDKKGKLLDYNYDAINDAKINDVKRGVQDCIKAGLVKEEGESALFKTDTDIYQGEVTVTAAGKKKIVRIPVVS